MYEHVHFDHDSFDRAFWHRVYVWVGGCSALSFGTLVLTVGVVTLRELTVIDTRFPIAASRKDLLQLSGKGRSLIDNFVLWPYTLRNTQHDRTQIAKGSSSIEQSSGPDNVARSLSQGHADGNELATDQAGDALAPIGETVSAIEFLKRSLREASPYRSDIDSTTFGKLGHLTISPYTELQLRLRPYRTPGDSGWPLAEHLPQSRKLPRHSRQLQNYLYDIPHGSGGQVAALPIKVQDLQLAVAVLRDLPTKWLGWYRDNALESPLLTKSATKGVCYAIGDLCAQRIAGKNLTALDIGRTMRSGAAGFIATGPITHHYFNFLDKHLSFGGAWWAVVPKVAIDIGPMTFVYNTLYSVLLGAFALRDPREIFNAVKRAFIPGFRASIRFWPFVHFVTFSVIPLELQVLWAGFSQVIYICILSAINHEGSDPLDYLGKDIDAKKTGKADNDEGGNVDSIRIEPAL